MNLSVFVWMVGGVAAGWASDFHVSPDGSADGDGSTGAPWSLEKALSPPASVHPGDTIWLHEGTYGSGGPTTFESNLDGTEAAPIVLRQAPGERAIVDGAINANGDFTYYWGFEITNSSLERVTTQADRPGGLEMYGRGVKAINLVIHDTGHPAIGMWSGNDGGEIYGCIIFGNGIFDSSEDGNDRGVGLYAQNTDGERLIANNFSFKNLTSAMQAYSADAADTNGFRFEDNTFCCGGNDWNLFVATQPDHPVSRLTVSRNVLYRREGDLKNSLQLGYYDTWNADMTVTDNYIVARDSEDDRGAFYARRWNSAVVTGNSFVGEGLVVRWEAGNEPGTLDWDHNSYFRFYDWVDPFLLEEQWKSLSEWQAATGFDLHSSFTEASPDGVRTWVRPNAYEPDRLHVTVVNWDLLSEVEVDLGDAMPSGHLYDVIDVENLFGGPVASGTYDGTSITVPMDLDRTQPLVGDVPTVDPSHTAPEFGMFLVFDRGPAPDAGGGSGGGSAGDDTGGGSGTGTSAGGCGGGLGLTGYVDASSDGDSLVGSAGASNAGGRPSVDDSAPIGCACGSVARSPGGLGALVVFGIALARRRPAGGRALGVR